MHNILPCGRCERYSDKCYYCELCRENFCDNCTVGEAHVKNFYESENLQNPKNQEPPNCSNIHDAVEENKNMSQLGGFRCDLF